MTDDDDEMEPGSLNIPGVPFPIPAAIVARIAHEHERDHMKIARQKMSLFAFLDSLSPDQLMELRGILNMSRDGVNFVDGQAAAQLRLVHKKDPDTGDDLLVS